MGVGFDGRGDHDDGWLLLLYREGMKEEKCSGPSLKLEETEAVTFSRIYSPSTLEGGRSADWSPHDEHGPLRERVKRVFSGQGCMVCFLSVRTYCCLWVVSSFPGRRLMVCARILCCGPSSALGGRFLVSGAAASCLRGVITTWVALSGGSL